MPSGPHHITPRTHVDEHLERIYQILSEFESRLRALEKILDANTAVKEAVTPTRD